MWTQVNQCPKCWWSSPWGQLIIINIQPKIFVYKWGFSTTPNWSLHKPLTQALLVYHPSLLSILKHRLFIRLILKTKKFELNIANGGSAKDQMFCLGLQMKSKKFYFEKRFWNLTWVGGWMAGFITIKPTQPLWNEIKAYLTSNPAFVFALHVSYDIVHGCVFLTKILIFPTSRS